MMNAYKYVKRGCLAVASVCSIFAGGYMLFDLFINGRIMLTSLLISFLAIAQIFLGISLVVILNDFYTIKKGMDRK